MKLFVRYSVCVTFTGKVINCVCIFGTILHRVGTCFSITEAFVLQQFDCLEDRVPGISKGERLDNGQKLSPMNLTSTLVPDRKSVV